MKKNINNSVEGSLVPKNSHRHSSAKPGFSQEIQHYLHPLEFYCWERDIGIPMKVAKFSAYIYEITLFRTFFANGKGDSRVSKLLKTLRSYSCNGTKNRL